MDKGWDEISTELTKEETERIMSAAEEILKVLAYAQGREESYKARRDELKVIQFPDKSR